MKELSSDDIKQVKGGIVNVIAAGVAAYYGEKVGRWVYKKLFK